MDIDSVDVDWLQFLCAIIDSQGGEVRFPYHLFATASPEEKALAIDFEDGGATVVLRLIDLKEVPDVAVGPTDV